jgi:dihydroorotase
MKILLKNTNLLDFFSNHIKTNFDILIHGDKIEAIDTNIEDKVASVIPVNGNIVAPGLIDVHVHFREPGQEHKETIYTGSRAAAAGGFTTVIAESNTLPPIDTPSAVMKVLKIAKGQSIVNFYSKACISRKAKGERLTDIRALKAAGALALSDDGNPVPGSTLMRNALQKGVLYHILVNPHCEESELYREKMKSKSLKLKQPKLFTGVMPYSFRPYSSETGFIKRDIELAERTGAKIHFSHVSLAKSVEEIAKAKKRGVPITAEATPHHFLLTEKDAKEIGTNAKVNPPLRSEEDVAAIRSGLIDGTIDIIATDHAPHTPQEKTTSWEKAPFGIIGLETSLGLVLTYLVQPGLLTLLQAIKKMSETPAKIFDLSSGIKEGAPADLTVIDPDKKWRVKVDDFYSKGRNCPFDGWELQGKAVMTIVRGQIVLRDGKIIEGESVEENEYGLSGIC